MPRRQRGSRAQSEAGASEAGDDAASITAESAKAGGGDAGEDAASRSSRAGANGVRCVAACTVRACKSTIAGVRVRFRAVRMHPFAHI